MIKTKGDLYAKASSLFLQGYNCAQSVLCSFIEEAGDNDAYKSKKVTLNNKDDNIEAVYNAVSKVVKRHLTLEGAKAATLAFGGGVCRTRSLCGCVTGMLILLGLVLDSGDTSDKSNKDNCYKAGQSLMKKFSAKFGSTICGELLTGGRVKEATDTSPVSSKRTEEYYKKRPCPDLVGEAAVLFIEEIEELRKIEKLNKEDKESK